MKLTSILLLLLIGCGKVASDHPDAPVATPDAPTCTVGSTFCGSDNAVYQCNSDGIVSNKVQDCQYGCTGGACNACTPNTMFCNGADISTCGASGNVSDTTSCMGHGCQMDRCNTCTPNEQFCLAGSAITCNADGTPGASMSCSSNGCTGGVCNACTPNSTSCQGDALVVCNASGTVASATNCALGCSTSGSPHCLSLVPSYNVAIPTGVDAFDLNIKGTATLDISNCTNTPSTVNLTIDTTTVSLVGLPQIALVEQSEAPPICVVRYNNIIIEPGVTLTIKNSSSTGQMLALEAQGTINIQGKIIFRNSAIGNAKGTNTIAVTNPENGHYIAPGAGGRRQRAPRRSRRFMHCYSLYY